MYPSTNDSEADDFFLYITTIIIIPTTTITAAAINAGINHDLFSVQKLIYTQVKIKIEFYHVISTIFDITLLIWR